jgi:transcriptional regulator with XRE-family HTH domain
VLGLGAAVRGARERCGISRRSLADATGLNARTIARIERGERRTRSRTLRIIAEVLSDDPYGLVNRLISVAGPALAPESQYAEKIEARRLKRRRRIDVLHHRADYACPTSTSRGEMGSASC